MSKNYFRKHSYQNIKKYLSILIYNIAYAIIIILVNRNKHLKFKIRSFLVSKYQLTNVNSMFHAICAGDLYNDLKVATVLNLVQI